MVAGWLRPRHERSPSTQVHSDLLNSFVTRKLEKFANHFLKSWTMKANTCLPISHEFTALCPPTLSLNLSAFTDTSCSQSAWNIQQAQQSLCERKKVHRSSHFRAWAVHCPALARVQLSHTQTRVSIPKVLAHFPASLASGRAKTSKLACEHVGRLCYGNTAWCHGNARTEPLSLQLAEHMLTGLNCEQRTCCMHTGIPPCSPDLGWLSDLTSHL